jgi:transposase
MAWRAVTDQQWKVIAQHRPPRKPYPRGGRPRLRDRQCVEGILWMLWTGASWSELPRRYGAKSAVHNRRAEGVASGILLHLWRALLVTRASEPIIPRRKHNIVATHQDGRQRRRDRHRWRIERTNSWRQNFRRLVVRYEQHVKHFEALVQMACALITVKKVSG